MHFLLSVLKNGNVIFHSRSCKLIFQFSISLPKNSKRYFSFPFPRFGSGISHSHFQTPKSPSRWPLLSIKFKSQFHVYLTLSSKENVKMNYLTGGSLFQWLPASVERNRDRTAPWAKWCDASHFVKWYHLHLWWSWFPTQVIHLVMGPIHRDVERRRWPSCAKKSPCSCCCAIVDYKLPLNWQKLTNMNNNRS